MMKRLYFFVSLIFTLFSCSHHLSYSQEDIQIREFFISLENRDYNSFKSLTSNISRPLSQTDFLLVCRRYSSIKYSIVSKSFNNDKKFISVKTSTPADYYEFIFTNHKISSLNFPDVNFP